MRRLTRITVAVPLLLFLASCNSSTNQNPTPALQSSEAPSSSTLYEGRWDGKQKTSIEIVSQEPLTVRYCFQRDCSNQEPEGTVENMQFTFPARARFRGAKMTMKKVGETYKGRYQLNGATRVSFATLVIK